MTVNKDASLNVTETIVITSEGNQIRHGIFRDFPTRYTEKNGISVNVDLGIDNVLQDLLDTAQVLNTEGGFDRFRR